MIIAQSTVTARGQISVPAEVRKKLGVGPGSVLEWDEQDGLVIVRRARCTSADVHRALFPEREPKSTFISLKEGIRKSMRKRQGRR